MSLIVHDWRLKEGWQIKGILPRMFTVEVKNKGHSAENVHCRGKQRGKRIKG
jgi:hypothetical protein